MLLTYSNKILSEKRTALKDANLAEASKTNPIYFILSSFSIQILGLIVLNLKNLRNLIQTQN